MTATDGNFAPWLSQAQLATDRLTVEQGGVLQAAFSFRQRGGTDYSSQRLLSHFLLHAPTGLKVAQIARRIGFSRPTASKQQGRSSQEAIQAAHHRLAGRPPGKLLPRFAGPIAAFRLHHPEASRYDVLDFIERTGSVRVSTVALHHFGKKFGWDRATRAAARASTATVPHAPVGPGAPTPTVPSTPAEPRRVELVPPSPGVPLPPPPFSRCAPSTRAPSC